MTWAKDIWAAVGIIVFGVVLYIGLGAMEHRANECHPVGHRICAWENSQ